MSTSSKDALREPVLKESQLTESISGQQQPSSTKLIVLVILLFYLGGATVQNTVLQFWIQTFPKGSGGPYFILCWASLLFTFFFGIMFFASKLINKPTSVSVKEYAGNYFLQGLANALNGVFLVYSSPITRTPPVIFSVLINSGIFFGMVLTKYLIPKKRHVNYLHKQIMISLGLLVVSILLTIAGDIYSKKGTDTKFGWATIFWILMTILASFFLALYNVLQERYLGMTNPELPDDKSVHCNLLQTLFYTSLVQLVLMVALFWVDIVPGFGYSDSLPAFWTNFQTQVQCFGFSAGCGYKCFLFGLLFVAGYITVYLAGIILNRDSANFVIYAVALQTPLSVLVFMVTGLGTSDMPLWSVIPSVLCIGVGILLWKRWEQKNDMDGTPKVH